MIRKNSIGRILLFYIFTVCLFLVGTVLGNQVVSVISENKPIAQGRTIVIDPGHGGEDGGATSYTGKLESSYNLEISLRLHDLLHLLGLRTVLTRHTDTSIYTQGSTISQKKISDLKERVRIANQTDNSVLVSIHQNSYPQEKQSGAQVFYNSNSESMELAQKMQACFVSALNPSSHRKSKQGSEIYLLEKAACPSILVECGFVSNQEEAILLAQSAYQKKIACIISSTLSMYISDT